MCVLKSAGKKLSDYVKRQERVRIMNNIQLIGRLTRNVEVNYNESNCYARFSLAVNRRFKNKQTGLYDTDFFNCVVFGKQAENLGNSGTGKGHRLYVNGELQFSKYTGNDGIERMTHSLIVSNYEYIETKTEAEAITNRNANGADAQGGGNNYSGGSQGGYGQGGYDQGNYGQGSMQSFGEAVPFDVEIPF